MGMEILIKTICVCCFLAFLLLAGLAVAFNI